MLTIREEQRAAFRLAAARNFEDRMIEHLRGFSPQHFTILGEPDLRKLIELGWQRAKDYGLTSERDVRMYVQLMLMLGSSFDSDPQVPWAAELLNDKERSDPTERLNLLTEKAWDYFEHVAKDLRAGVGSARLERFAGQAGDIFQELGEILEPSELPTFYRDMAAHLSGLFPYKCEYVGELHMLYSTQQCVEAAQSHGVDTCRGVALYVALAFVFGSSFDSDPQFPWAGQALHDEGAGDPEARVELLFERAVACLKQLWG